MSLSRKRRRELKKLKKLTGALLEEQRQVLGHAGAIASEAGSQVVKLSDEHLAPRVNAAYETVRPTVEGGLDVARAFGKRLRQAVNPYAATTVQRAIQILEDTDNKAAAKKLKKYGRQTGILKRSSKGGIIALVLGTIAAAAVGFSLWQAFSDEEELWVAPEGAETDKKD